jgi:tryptophan 2,3-dioxygenase
MLRASMATTTESQDEFAPILPGKGGSDYERYLRTDELLALQKPEAERAHHDELLFQTVHQASELWLQLAWTEAELATTHLRDRELAPANRLLRRSVDCLKRVHDALDMLEHLAPWEYTRWVRPVLGHGSGFDSPGFNGIRRVSPDLGAAFHELRREAELSIVELYQRNREFEELYTVAELLTEWDERVTMWRVRHLKVIGRIIGEGQIGTQGTPVELLAKLIHQKLYPELWEARNELTEAANREIADAPGSSEPGHGG